MQSSFHHIVHERQGDTWTTRVGHYPKLRLAPDNIVARLEQLGLSVTRDCGPSGMVRIAAVAAANHRYRRSACLQPDRLTMCQAHFAAEKRSIANDGKGSSPGIDRIGHHEQ